jgi:hypothetical protein
MIEGWVRGGNRLTVFRASFRPPLCLNLTDPVTAGAARQLFP